MKNKYLVEYMVSEGDNYAGGDIVHCKQIDSLDDLYSIRRVVNVYPVTIGEPMQEAIWKECIRQGLVADKKRRAERSLRNAELEVEKKRKELEAI